MADVKWIKIVTDIFGNRKIKQIESMPDADAILVIWFKLLCLAGNVNEGGLITITKDIPYTDEMLSTEFHRPLATIRLALSIFERFGMIEIVDNVLCVSNWEKYQNTSTLNRIREQTRARVSSYRERQDALACENVTLHVTQCNATDKEEEEDIDKEVERESREKAVVPDGTKSHRFSPPTIEEIQAYVTEKSMNVDAEKFWNFYESKGWLIGKSPMKSWKAACSTWNLKDKPPHKALPHDPELDKYDLMYEEKP